MRPLAQCWIKLRHDVPTGSGDSAPVIPAGVLVRVATSETFGRLHVFWEDQWAMVDLSEIEFCGPPRT